MNTRRIIILCLFAFTTFSLYAQDECKATSNFFESLGGRSSDLIVKESNDCKKLVMDSGFEIVTLVLGNIPDDQSDFTVVNYDAEPGAGEISVKYYAYGGNEPETLEFDDSGKTAHVCKSEGKVIITWSDVKFKGTVNGKITYKTACEMSFVLR